MIQSYLFIEEYKEVAEDLEEQMQLFGLGNSASKVPSMLYPSKKLDSWVGVEKEMVLI